MPNTNTFQTVSIEGKPHIVITTAPKESAKRHRIDYKTRSQKFPLREHLEVTNLSSGDANRPQPQATSSQSISSGNGNVMNNKSKFSGARKDDTVTLTSSQLAAILQSAQQKSSSKLGRSESIPRKPDNNASHLTRQGSYRDTKKPTRPLSHDRNRPNRSATLDKPKPPRAQLASQSMQRASKKTSNPSGQPEHLLGLLNKVTKKSNSLQPRSREENTRVPFNMRGARENDDELDEETAPPRNEMNRGRRPLSVSSEDENVGEDSDVLDAVMKRIIEENKDKLSEEQLVELLSQVYIQGKQKSPSHRDEKRKAPFSSAHNQQHDENETIEFEGGPKVANHRSRHHKSRHDEREIHSPLHLSDGESDVHEMNHSAKPPSKAPKSLSMMEMKRLQWEKEKDELAAMSNYNPWNTAQSTRISQRSSHHEVQMEPIGNPSRRRDLKKYPSNEDGLLDARLPYAEKVTGARPQLNTLVEHNRREKERAISEALLNRRSGADHSMASRLVGASEDESKRQKELARQKWVEELNAQKAENDFLRQRDLQYGAEVKLNKVNNSAIAVKPPQFARGRGLADLQEKGAQGNRANGIHELPNDEKASRRLGSELTPSNQSLPPWLR